MSSLHHVPQGGASPILIQGKIMPNAFLDAKGLNCPLPILRAKKAIQALDIGGLLDIQATDPGAVKDFAAFCRSTGNELLSSVQEGNVYKFTIKRVK